MSPSVVNDRLSVVSVLTHVPLHGAKACGRGTSKRRSQCYRWKRKLSNKYNYKMVVMIISLILKSLLF